MNIKKFARLACVTAVAGITAFSAGLSGCAIETKHPNVEINVEFNDVTYTFKFKLYRNMYPQTVKHFIELADAGFYNETVIHDYQTKDWFGGGYDYVEEQTGDKSAYASSYSKTGGMTDYFTETSKEEYYYKTLYNGGNGVLTPSVYKSYYEENDMFMGENPLPTLIGEFTNNDHEVKYNALTSRKGALRMYYTPISTTEKVWVHTTKDDEAFERDYEYNSATSLFAIQVSSSSSLASSDYCIFGHMLRDKDLETLDELKDAIAEYIEDYYSDDETKFTQSVEVEVNNYDQVANPGVAVTYTSTAEPIIIRTVKVTKY